MELLECAAQFGVKANVKLYGFPADEIKTYHDYLLLGESPLFPTLREIKSRKYLVDSGKNSVLNIGIDWIKDLITATVTGSLTHAGVGSGTTAVDKANDTDLETAIGSRISIQTRSSGGTGVANFDTFYTAGDNNGTWEEAILAWSSSGANAFARKLLTSTFTKDATKTALLAWSITITIV